MIVSIEGKTQKPCCHLFGRMLLLSFEPPGDHSNKHIRYRRNSNLRRHPIAAGRLLRCLKSFLCQVGYVLAQICHKPGASTFTEHGTIHPCMSGKMLKQPDPYLRGLFWIDTAGTLLRIPESSGEFINRFPENTRDQIILILIMEIECRAIDHCSLRNVSHSDCIKASLFNQRNKSFTQYHPRPSDSQISLLARQNVLLVEYPTVLQI